MHKVLASVLGDNFKVKRMPSGDLLVEIENKKQSTGVLNLNLVADSRVTEASRRSLNTVWGVIFEDDLLDRCNRVQAQRVLSVRFFAVKINSLTQVMHPSIHILLIAY